MKSIPQTGVRSFPLLRRAWAGLAGGLLLLLAGPLSAANTPVREVALPEGLSSAQSIALDAHGRVWFSEKVGKKLGVFDPQDQRFETYSIPASWGEVGFSKIAVGPAGDIWFTMHRWVENAQDPNMLGRFSPGDGYFTKYALSIDAIPEDIFVAGDGVVWFVANNKNSLYRVDPENFRIKGYAIPTANASPRGITADASGNIWFSEANANKIGKFVPGEEVFYEYEVPTDFANPGQIAIDEAGRVWFVETTANRLGVFYPDLLRFDEALIPTPKSSPNAIAVDDQGRLWFSQYRANKVGVFDPRTAVFQEFDIPTFTSLPGELVIDSRRSILWFTQSSTEAKSLGMLSLKEALPEGNGAGARGVVAPAGQEAGADDAPAATMQWLVAVMLVVAAVFVGGGWYRYSRRLRNS